MGYSALVRKYSTSREADVAGLSRYCLLHRKKLRKKRRHFLDKKWTTRARTINYVVLIDTINI